MLFPLIVAITKLLPLKEPLTKFWNKRRFMAKSETHKRWHKDDYSWDDGPTIRDMDAAITSPSFWAYCEAVNGLAFQAEFVGRWAEARAVVAHVVG
jgi:hypothetical protein